MADHGGMVWKSDVRSLMMSPVFRCAIGQCRVFINYECSLHIDLDRPRMRYGAVNCTCTGLMPMMSAGFFRRIDDALGFSQYCCHRNVYGVVLQISDMLIVYTDEFTGFIVGLFSMSVLVSSTNLRPPGLVSPLHLASLVAFKDSRAALQCENDNTTEKELVPPFLYITTSFSAPWMSRLLGHFKKMIKHSFYYEFSSNWL